MRIQHFEEIKELLMKLYYSEKWESDDLKRMAAGL